MRATVSPWSLRLLQLDPQQLVIHKETVHPVNGLLSSDRRVVTDKSKALTESTSLVHKHLFIT